MSYGREKCPTFNSARTPNLRTPALDQYKQPVTSSPDPVAPRPPSGRREREGENVDSCRQNRKRITLRTVYSTKWDCCVLFARSRLCFNLICLRYRGKQGYRNDTAVQGPADSARNIVVIAYRRR